MIIDEAENLPYRALEIARRIHDKTGVGVLLVGRSILLENLKGYNNQYDQLYSRVKYTKILNRIQLVDIARFNDKAEVDSAVIQETSKLLMA